MIAIEKGKIVIRPEHITDGEDMYHTISSLLWLLQSMSEDSINIDSVYYVTALIESFMPSAEQWNQLLQQKANPSAE